MPRDKKIKAMKRVGAVASFYLVASMSMNSPGMQAMDDEIIHFLKTNSDTGTIFKAGSFESNAQATQNLIACTNYYLKVDRYLNSGYYLKNKDYGKYTKQNDYQRENYYAQSKT